MRKVPEARTEREKAYRQALGRRIRTLRRARELNQDELAAKAYLHRAHMGFVENAKQDMTLQTLLRVADALDMPLSDLVALSEEELEGVPPALSAQP